jgi:anti-sigma regulatory factor (Ser/Thr protein kinase)
MSVGSVVDPREHVAHFYACDDELVDRVSAYVIEALTSGETAMVVATRLHHSAFEATLVEAGIDPDRARTEERLITVDATEALHSIVIDGRPDADAFTAEIGGLVPRLVETGRPLRVYGEVVALLWHAGNVGAAIELERLWVELCNLYPFGLYCAYPANSLAFTHNGADAVRQVCECHSTVIGVEVPVAALGGAEAARVFPWDLVSVAASRRFVTETLASWGLPQVVDDAALIVSELATNAVLHARSPFTVLLSWEAGILCISVLDDSASVPSVKHPSTTTISGRGLRLVAAVARRWGTDRDGNGKLVWAELPT